MGLALTLVLALGGCDGSADPDSGVARDASRADAGRLATDAGPGQPDAGLQDGGTGSSRCPPGSGALTLDLDGVTLEAVPGVPIGDDALTGFSILEGPVWAAGALYVSHFNGATGRIYRVDASGASVARAGFESNGLAIGFDGRLYAGVHGDGTVSSLELAALATATPTVIAGQYEGRRFNSPNDLAIRSDGNLYFTDPTWQAPSPAPHTPSAYRVDPEGNVTRLTDLPNMPNGILLSLDEQRLYVGGQGTLRYYTVDPLGAVSATATRVDAISFDSDGLGIDCAGNLYVTGNDRVTILDPSHAVIGSFAVRGATNVAFGGDDGRTLHITALGSPPTLHRARLNVPGLPY